MLIQERDVSPRNRLFPKLFPVLPPALVPHSALIRMQLGDAALGEIADFASRAEMLPHATRAAALAALRAGLPADYAMPETAPGVQTSVVEADAGQRRFTADESAHDGYFRIGRAEGPAGALFVRSIVHAAELFHSEMDMCHGGEDRDRFDDLSAGFAALLGRVAGKDVFASRDAVVSSAMDALVDPMTLVDPTRRWVIGHQVFAVLSQGIVFALELFETAMREANDRIAAAGLCLAGDLLLASAAAFRFTADFPPSDYRDLIRPSMCSSQVGEGFSGLLSADHRYLVEVMTRVRPLMGEAETRFASAHAYMSASLHRVYDDHRFVCARFDGAEKASIRGQNCNELSGVETLDRFKHARIRLLRPGRRRNGERGTDRRVPVDAPLHAVSNAASETAE